MHPSLFPSPSAGGGGVAWTYDTDASTPSTPAAPGCLPFCQDAQLPPAPAMGAVKRWLTHSSGGQVVTYTCSLGYEFFDVQVRAEMKAAEVGTFGIF